MIGGEGGCIICFMKPSFGDNGSAEREEEEGHGKKDGEGFVST